MGEMWVKWSKDRLPFQFDGDSQPPHQWSQLPDTATKLAEKIWNFCSSWSVSVFLPCYQVLNSLCLLDVMNAIRNMHTLDTNQIAFQDKWPLLGLQSWSIPRSCFESLSSAMSKWNSSYTYTYMYTCTYTIYITYIYLYNPIHMQWHIHTYRIILYMYVYIYIICTSILIYIYITYSWFIIIYIIHVHGFKGIHPSIWAVENFDSYSTLSSCSFSW